MRENTPVLQQKKMLLHNLEDKKTLLWQQHIEIKGIQNLPNMFLQNLNEHTTFLDTYTLSGGHYNDS